MSLGGISARLRQYKKHELPKSPSQSQILASKLQQDGVMGTVDNVMQIVEQVSALLVNKSSDSKLSYKDNIMNLGQHLKVYGPYLEHLYQDQLNRAFVVFRNSSQDDERLDYLSRLYLLELIELRAKNWKGTDFMYQYYKNKISQCVQLEAVDTTSLTDSMSSAISTAPILAAGEILKPSGKFAKPTRILGKNYCKDEVVIRNSDSGKVNPGAKERLVQITGANEESINHAKQLIEDTIRRNASPVREQGVSGPLTGSSSSINSSASEDSALPHSARASRTLIHSLSTNDASIGEFKYSVVVGSHVVKIAGDNLELVRTCKLVLDEFFSGEPLEDLGQLYGFDNLPQPIPTHESTESPLSPPESLPSPGLPNGQPDDFSGSLRRPRSTAEDIMLGKTHTESEPSQKCMYSLEYLIKLSMSPYCLTQPDDWNRISSEFPNLVRKQAEVFDCKQYLSNRNNNKQQNMVVCASETESAEV